jgi:hypothetical protein
MKEKQDKEEVIHNNSECSKCGQSPIKGIRYYCLQCQNYNLCSSCENKYGERHGHQLLMLRRPEIFEMFKKHINKNNLNKDDDEEKEKIIDLSKCQLNAVYVKEQYLTRNNNNFIPIEVILKNAGQEQWPSPCFFTCDENSEVKGQRIKLAQYTGKGREEYKIKIKINLNNINKSGIYKSIWQLRNEKGDEFGQKITFIIKDIFEKDLKLFTKKDFRDELEEKVKQIKMKYDILFTSANIRNALIRTRGNSENAVKMLFTEQNK